MSHNLADDFHQLAEKLKILDLLTSPRKASHGRPAEPPLDPPDKHIRRELQEAGYLAFAAMKDGALPQIPADSVRPEWLIKGGKFLRSDAPFFETVVMPAVIPTPPGFSLALLAAAACEAIARALEVETEPEPAKVGDTSIVVPAPHIFKCRACGWQSLLVVEEPAKCCGCKRTVAGFDVVR